MALWKVPRQKIGKVWTPTLTIVAGIDTLVFRKAFYAINGDVVECYVCANVDPTGAAAFSFRISLPFGTKIANVWDVIGLCAPSTAGGYGGTVYGDTTNHEAVAESLYSGVPLELMAHFAYRVT